MLKRNLFRVFLILLAAYFSFYGITYEKAVLENTMAHCCENNQCYGNDCSTSCGYMVEDGVHVYYDAMKCVLLFQRGFCEYYGCEFWGLDDLRCPNLNVGDISGPSELTIPPKGSTYTVSFSTSVSGGWTISPYSYSWGLGGSTSSSSSFSYTYSYRQPGPGTVALTVTSADGQSESRSKNVYFSNIILPKSNEGEKTSTLLNNFTLEQNYPNPFNPTTQINYNIPKQSFVSIKVYDALGNEVADLVSRTQSEGYYTVSFNAANLPSGIYFYTLNTGNYNETKKMILTK